MGKLQVFIQIMTVLSMSITGVLMMDELHGVKWLSIALGVLGIITTAVINVFGKSWSDIKAANAAKAEEK